MLSGVAARPRQSSSCDGRHRVDRCDPFLCVVLPEAGIGVAVTSDRFLSKPGELDSTLTELR
jgi:hypothetical protein